MADYIYMINEYHITTSEKIIAICYQWKHNIIIQTIYTIVVQQNYTRIPRIEKQLGILNAAYRTT